VSDVSWEWAEGKSTGSDWGLEDLWAHCSLLCEFRTHQCMLLTAGSAGGWCGWQGAGTVSCTGVSETVQRATSGGEAAGRFLYLACILRLTWFYKNWLCDWLWLKLILLKHQFLVRDSYWVLWPCVLFWNSWRLDLQLRDLWWHRFRGVVFHLLPSLWFFLFAWRITRCSGCLSCCVPCCVMFVVSGTHFKTSVLEGVPVDVSIVWNPHLNF